MRGADRPVRPGAPALTVVVLQVNKFFHPRAGAETSFLQTRELLRDHGHEVVDFAMRHPANLPSEQERHFAPERDYADGGGAAKRGRDALSSVYSLSARRALRRLLSERRPDVAHLHNVYHQLTLSVVDELARQRIPIVLTLHDYKIVCPAYTLFTEGAPCRRCVHGSVVNAVRHKCVKDSRLASGLAMTEAALARRRGTYAKVDRFVAPSRFAAEVAREGRIDPGRVVVVPNFLTDEELAAEAPSAADTEPSLLYAGRLDATKGIRQLLAAFAPLPPSARLRIAGSGELEGQVRAAAEADARIAYLGRLDKPALMAEFERARAVVLPSIWEDNGPFVILEAQARGRPLVVTDRGGPKEFVRQGESGCVVPAEEVGALAESMGRLLEDPTLAGRMGACARRAVEREHNARRHYERLMDVYRDAIAEVR